MTTKYATYTDSVCNLQKENRLRKLKPMIPINGAFILFEDQKMLSFCSHDYLGLADNPETKKNAIKFLLEHGITASSESQDLYLTCQHELEKKLSEMLRRDTALFFSSRYEANVTALSTLGHKAATLFIDEGCHTSLQKGATISESQVLRYPHKRLDRLEHFLEDAKTPTKIIITESVFSLTGSISNLPTLIELAEHFEALLFVDDSHAFGVTGVDGIGLAAHLNEIDIITGSFSKACGAYGGYIACSETIRDYLVSMAPIKSNYFFPPPIIGAIEAVLGLIPQLEGERRQLEQRSHWLRSALRQLGFEQDKTNTPLISLLFNNPEEVESLRTHLKSEKILVGPTRSFQGEEGTPRLNLALNVCHMPDHLTRLVDAIKSWQNTTVNSTCSLAFPKR
ncbi:MAG: 8-amino-7-oxononanoate synthase [Chlamydiae bacterium]|nr:8-amino-7-oxononanoate synthase [Chlamydiota bacterium]